jgi:hypothetical protein
MILGQRIAKHQPIGRRLRIICDFREQGGIPYSELDHPEAKWTRIGILLLTARQSSYHAKRKQQDSRFAPEAWYFILILCHERSLCLISSASLSAISTFFPSTQ